MKIRRTHSGDTDFLALIAHLDRDLSERYGTLQLEYDRHNRLPHLETVVVGSLGETPVACGCFKPSDDQTVEIKRMFVRPDHRGRGFSRILLRALEEWAVELDFRRVILETGNRQAEALGLYESSGYRKIENFGPYREMAASRCLGKWLDLEPSDP